jgi:amino acid adenylation domain-containing protein
MDATLAYRGDTSRSRLQWTSIVELLRSRAQRDADRRLYTFLSDGPTAESSLTFAELDQRACAIAARLQSAGASRQRVLLLFPPGLDYIAAFFGCLYAEDVAVPAYPPRQNRNLERLAAVVHDAQPIVVLTTQAILSQIERWRTETADLKMLQWIAIDSISQSWAGRWKQPDVNGESLAFLQYTSGSTASPKGVMVTHGNLLHNEEIIQRAFGQTEQSIIVGWLPLFHDMGLIGNVLQPLYVGAQCVLLSPISFLQRPFRWLEAISKYRATTSGGPNFAYDFCVRKISPAQRQALDLSSWTIAFNGSEPVRPETLDRFCAAFEPCGFQRRAFSPCYGLAEATLFVSGGPNKTDPKVKAFKRTSLEQNDVVPTLPDDGDARRLVSCGAGSREQQIRIVDPQAFVECPSGRVGEIWVAGASIAQGYWNNPDESKRIFQASLADSAEGNYLRTGDLGFIDGDQLFITGRLKDLIIIRGRNCYPEDIEHSAGLCDPALRPGEGAAFSLDIDREERLVVVHEVTKNYRANNLVGAIDNIRKVLAEEHDLQLYAVTLIKPGTMLKTSSGKIRRQAMKNAFAKGKLDVVLRWELSEASMEPEGASADGAIGGYEAIKEWIAARIASMLGLTRSHIDVDVSIARYGLDSLAALELAHSLELNLDASLPVITFMQDVTISELAVRVLEQLEQPAGSREAPLPARHRQASIPLSHGQAALWFLHQLAPQSASYNVVSSARIRGSLNIVALKNAFQLLTDRHAELRVKFEVRDGDPVQTIQESASVSFQEEDVTGWSDQRLRQRLREETYRPFDLENGPVFRVTLLAVAKGEHVLLIAAHHIVIDMWSLAVLVQELGVLYTSQETGLRASVGPLELSYQDYVQWQQTMLDGPQGARLLEYWQRQLAGELPILNLNTDHSRPSVQTYEGASAWCKLDRETVLRLQRLARENLTTVNTVLLAAYLTLLNRHTGQEELIVGTPTSGRTDGRFQQLVGYFVNTIPIRVTLPVELTFRQFLAQVREVVLAGFEHQDYPFALLVDKICPDRDPSRSPVFQTTFVFEKAPAFSDPSLAAFVMGQEGAQLELGSLTLESVKLDQEIAQFDLSMVVAPIGDELTIALQYNKNLFNSVTVSRMLEHFKILVGEIAADAELRIFEIGMLSEAEEGRLREFNRTKAEYGREEYVHELFEAQARERPEAIAVISEENQLSYGEVNRRANQLAHHLRKLGVGPETRVAILLQRSPQLIISLLAVLKAGGAYLPLDAAYPQERLTFMLEDTEAAVVITEQALGQSLPEQRGQLVSLEAEAERIAGESGADPVAWVKGGNLSHIIYTSGSTGRPKGVGIAHGSVVNFLHWAEQSFTGAEMAGVLLATSICFDLSVFEIFAPLSCGGSVIVADDALHLATHEAAAAVTLINTVPSAMAELLRLQAVGEQVLAVNLAGEALPQKLVQQLYAETQVRRVQNLYGPTEYTTYTTGVELARESLRPPSIGGPIANTEVYIVDEAGGLVPLGVSGEVLVGGRGLARGYWQRPELTAERFVPDGLSGAAAERLYRTGDLGRYLENGEIEYLGRKDHQVKIRGYRIELGEIEAVLATCPGVDAAAVVVKEEESGHKYLAGYVVGAALLSTGHLRRFLYSKLPSYMVPATLMRLEQLHLTPNGKIDRKTLPEPVREAGTEVYIAPRTQAEKTLAAIWEQVLKVEQVSVSDNFFDLGGDSILSIHVVTQARRAGLILTPRQFFQQQTLASLALVAEESDRLDLDLKPDEILNETKTDETNVEDVYPLTPFQQGMLFHVLDASDAGMYLNQQRYTLKGELDLSAFKSAFQSVMDRHQILRTAFNLSAPDGPLQVVYRRLNLPWTVHDWREFSSAEESERLNVLLRTDYECGFDLTHPPLMRITLIRTEPDVYEFIWSFHLLLMDGWSVQVIFNELLSFYRAFRTGQPVTLEPPIRYHDYIDWLQRQPQDQAEAYWRQALANFTSPTSLGFDRTAVVDAPSTQTYKEKSLVLDDPTTTALRAFAGRHRLTLNTLIQGAWALLLGRRSGSDDVVFGSVVAGRAADFPGIDSAVGVFVNALPARVHVPTDGAVVPWLEDLQRQQVDARRFEFCSLVSIQGWSEVPRRQPLFESALIFQNIQSDIALPESEGVKVLGISSTERSNLPLALVVDPGSRLVFRIVYQSSRFEDATIARILENLQRTIIKITTDPSVTLGSLSYQADAERKLLIDSFTQSLATQ